MIRASEAAELAKQVPLITENYDAGISYCEEEIVKAAQKGKFEASVPITSVLSQMRGAASSKISVLRTIARALRNAGYRVRYVNTSPVPGKGTWYISFEEHLIYEQRPAQ